MQIAENMLGLAPRPGCVSHLLTQCLQARGNSRRQFYVRPPDPWTINIVGCFSSSIAVA